MLTFAEDGAECLPCAAAGCLEQLRELAGRLPVERAGVRITDDAALRSLLHAPQPFGNLARAVLGPRARPERAILFDKSHETNWSLPWHQDRTICVHERRTVEGFKRWTVKAGRLHVEPPAGLLMRMVTMRVHLDPCSADNAPLLIVPGSHREGRIEEGRIDTIVEGLGTAVCQADAGDIWLYATLILHASRKSERPSRRRVLQVDYAAEELPGGLARLGV